MSRRNMVAQVDWMETKAKVTSSTYHFARASEIDLEAPSDKSFYSVAFSYEVENNHFAGEFEQFEPALVGSVLTIFYNPANPSENSLGLYPEPLKWRMVKLILGGALAGVLIYLSQRFGWKE